MARKVFFSFHYQRDLWRVNVIRNSAVIEGVAAAGFHDASLWEESMKKGDSTIKALIDSGIKGTSVTVVLIGNETASRKYVDYEIEKSVACGNSLLGILIHHVKNSKGEVDLPGLIPPALLKYNAPLYTYEYGKLGAWVEAAYKKTHPKA